MTVSTSAPSSWIRLTAEMPSMPGRRTSMITTSGFSRPVVIDGETAGLGCWFGHRSINPRPAPAIPPDRHRRRAEPAYDPLVPDPWREEADVRLDRGRHRRL